MEWKKNVCEENKINITSRPIVLSTFTFCSLTTVWSSASPIPTVSKMCVGLRRVCVEDLTFPSSLFFLNHNFSVGSGVCTFLATFINDTPDAGKSEQWFLLRISVWNVRITWWRPIQNHSKHWFNSRLWQKYLALNWSIYTFGQGPPRPLAVNSDSDCQRPLNSRVGKTSLANGGRFLSSFSITNETASLWEIRDPGYLQQARIYKTLKFLV